MLRRILSTSWRVCRRGSSGSIAYLEQTLSEMIIKALTAVEEHRSSLTHPALSIEGSCKAFVALYLKANNAAAEPHARQRAEARLKQFLEECTVSEKLRTAAARGSAVKAARQSPRVSSEVRQLGEQFDKLRSEPKPLLMRRYLRPEPVAFK